MINDEYLDPEVEWMERGLCHGIVEATRDLFSPSDQGQKDGALVWCTGCPVKSECLEYALTYKEQYGVWGGLTESERAKKRKGK